MADSIIGNQIGLYQNVSTIITCLRDNMIYTAMQVRDDVDGNPSQFPGGWRKTDADKTPYHTAVRELIEEFGINLSEKNGLYLPFVNPDDQFFVHPKFGNKFHMVLTEIEIPYSMARQLDAVKREGARIELTQFGRSLLNRNLYAPFDFSQDVREDLESKIINHT